MTEAKRIDISSCKLSIDARKRTSKDDDEPELRGPDEGVSKSLTLRQVVDGEEHELNPDQCESGPSEETMGVLEGVVETLAEGGVGEDDDAEELSQDDIGDGDGADR